MRVLKNEKKKGTLMPHEDKSLFKYVLYYNCPRTAGMPGVLYSFDEASEREKFMPGVAKSNKARWMNFIAELDGDFYNFFGGSYPEFFDEKVVIKFTNTPSAVQFLSNLTDTERAIIRELSQRNGFQITSLSPVQYNVAGKPKPDVTPKFYKELEKLNGMNAVQKWIREHFLPKGLIEIQTYDNIAIHSDNLISVQKFSNQEVSVPQSTGTPLQTNFAQINDFENRKEAGFNHISNLIPNLQ